MSTASFLARVTETLERIGIRYMVAGSFASSHHGAPRTTQDIDIVANPSLSELELLVAALQRPDTYLDAEVAREELGRRGQFNVIDVSSGWKVDVIFAKQRSFSRMELTRRVRANVLGVDLFLASAEDTVLSKLEWAKLGGSERQVRDASGIVELQGTALDRAYIEGWLDELGVRDLWERVLASSNQ